MTGATVEQMIEMLQLERHPEGGWFRETWRTDASPGRRAAATAIYFLLDAGGRSHWHRVDAAELWLWHAGSSLTLSIAADRNLPVQTVSLGADLAAGQRPQALVPAGQWQAAATNDGWTLVSCVVSRGFEFSGFELAPQQWQPNDR